MHLVSLVGYTTVWTLLNDAGGKKFSTYAPSVAKAKSRLCIHGPSRILNGCPIIHYLLGCNQACSHGGAMHPLQFWVHLLGIFRKMSRTDLLISSLQNVRNPAVSTCCLLWTIMVGNDSFAKMYAFAKYAQRYRGHYIIKLLILLSRQTHFLSLCIHIYTAYVQRHHTCI